MLVCKCCGEPAAFIGSLDFNKTAMDQQLGRRLFPVSTEMVPYYKCTYCGFIFTDYCDKWSVEEFRTRIYNDEHGLTQMDPDAAKGPTAVLSYRRGTGMSTWFDGLQSKVRILDFGSGGNPGLTAQAMIDKGFSVTSYEPYVAGGSTALAGTFDIIYAIEVIEHCHDLASVTRFLADHLATDGLLHLQTSIHPHPAPANILDSWYIAPRNGHISIFTLMALTLLFRPVGINIFQNIFGIFGIRKSIPSFPNMLFV